MKKKIKILSLLLITFISISCDNSEDDANDQNPMMDTVTLSVSQNNVIIGNTLSFMVVNSENQDVSSQSQFFVNNTQINGNMFTFSQTGTFQVSAVYNGITTNTVEIIVTETSVNQYVSRVLVEEYSGTWCGNCPRILYGVDLLKQQTNKVEVVQIHLFGNDPFITSQGNTLASNQNINSVPRGKINKILDWDSPQYLNVDQPIEQIKSSANVGLAIKSTLNNSNLNIDVTMGFVTNDLQTKLTVYLVEDNLFHTQTNYSSNLYGGLTSIQNFEYDGVLRSVVSNLNGDSVTISENSAQKSYSINLPNNINNNNNVRIVAFLTNTTTNEVVNVRSASLNQNQTLETL